MGTSTCVLPTFRSQVPAKSWITPRLQCKVCSGREAGLSPCPRQGHCLPAEMSLYAVTALLLLPGRTPPLPEGLLIVSSGFNFKAHSLSLPVTLSLKWNELRYSHQGLLAEPCCSEFFPFRSNALGCAVVSKSHC